MLKPVIHDTILYGNSFLQITLGNSIVKLQILEPTDLAFTIDWVPEPPFKSYAEKIVEIKKQGDSSSVRH
jgi:hypothetical protein